jgi:tetratricopeptide (TPR) repeat protein
VQSHAAFARTKLVQDATRLIDLSDVRADGWLEELGEDIPEFDQLCSVIGRRFVGFSFIAGVRISSIAYDPQAPHTSLVDFVVGDSDTAERLTLADFRERLGAALLAASDSGSSLPAEPTSEDLRSFIGRRYLLLSSIFGIHLDAVELGREPMLRIELGGTHETITLNGLRDVLHNAIRSELTRSRPNQPFSIDFKKIPLAEAANARGEHHEAIALLGAWPGPLSMFLRTPQGQALGATERSKLVRALGALGVAYLNTKQLDWAEDVLRLGIQFGQELPAAAVLFSALGQVRVESERPGEAIGLLRRALALGGSKAVVLPALARCFVARGRAVAAATCLEQARTAGADPELLEPLEKRVEEALGAPLLKVRELLTSTPPGRVS